MREIAKEKQEIQITVGEGRLAVHISAVFCGYDLLIKVQGGAKPHIGAAAMALSWPHRDRALGTSATACVLCAPGHKEDLLARDVALQLSARLNRTVCVVAGIHVEDITPEEIKKIEEYVQCAERLLAEKLLLV